jgi:hypothetical protein
MKRTTVFLPEELHERLRREAFRAKISMAELIRLKLTGSKPRAVRRKVSDDPILKVAGIWSGPVISENIDEELYGI